MKIKWKIGALFGVLFVLVAGMFGWVAKGNTVLIVLGEVFLLVLLIVFGVMLDRIFRPLDHLGTGLAALKDQDFTSQLRYTGSAETDKLVEVYNRMMTNIREERRYQQEQHFFLENLIASLPVGLVVLDYDQKLAQFNPVARRILGIEEGDKGKRLIDTGMQLAAVLEAHPLQEGKTYRLGGAQYVRVYADTFRRRGFFQKFIIVEEASEEVLRIERASYGKVIRMMAHEVKNSVGAVNSILSTLKASKDQEILEEYLGVVMDRNTRLHSFMENFARVVRLEGASMERVNFSDAVHSIYHLYKFHKQGVKVSLELPDAPVWLRGNREQLEQVLINVLLNAMEAIEEEGEIKLLLSDRSMVITDTGTGIPEEVKSSLFTPFFSTKPNGQGVGLTMVREILHYHGMEFGLSSEGGITSFKVNFNK
jgi:two-component system nitrogen regulation sensor histidine kinase NtrY